MLLTIFMLAAIGAVAYLREQTPQQPSVNTSQQYAVSTFPTTVDSHPGMKLYRNEQFGFEFWYPEGWEWERNALMGPSTKFEMTVVKIDGRDTSQHDSIDIYTQDFLENYLINMQRLNAKESEIMIDNITGTQYRYDFEGMKMVDVYFPLREFVVFIGVEGQHEVGLKSILSTFKFTK